MFRTACSIIILLALSACAQVVPPSEIKGHIKTEAMAREMVPPSDMAILYVLPTGDPGGVPIYIDGIKQVSAWGVLTGIKNFYAFCLSPGEHVVEYSDNKEFLKVSAGDVIVREIDVGHDIVIILSIQKIKVRDISKEQAKTVLAGSQLAPVPGRDMMFPLYQSSAYRCNFE